MRNLVILALEFLFLALTPLVKLRQSISNCVSIALAVIHSKMVLREFLGPCDLPRIYALGIHKSVEIIMIGKHKNFYYTTLQVVASSIKGFNYGQQFLIMGFAPSLYQNHFPKEKGYRVPLAGLRG